MSTGMGMLKTLSLLQSQAGAPSEAELEAERRAAVLRSCSKINGYHARVFDMGVGDDVSAYQELMLKFMSMPRPDIARSGQGYAVITFSERRFSDRTGTPGWHIYVEWYEGVIEEKPVA